MPLINNCALLFVLLGILFAVIIINIVFLPLFYSVIYTYKINKLLAIGLLQETKQFCAQRFFRRKNLGIKQLLGTHYIFIGFL